MTVLFVDHLTVLDFSLLDGAGLHGESWIVDLELEGELDDQGMVFDFGHVKRVIRDAIEAAVDHKLVVAADDPRLALGRRPGELRYETRSGPVEHCGPDEAVAILEAEAVTMNAVRTAIEFAARLVVPPNVHQVRCALREEAIGDAPHYRYTHGLRKHDGNCQRIAHGHRSRIQVFRDGARAPDCEREIAALLRSSYLAWEADLLGEMPGGLFQFGYNAPQGRFELTLPKHFCHLMGQETTVENIAQHLADQLKAAAPGHAYRVRAFEGVNKGAIGLA